MTTDGAVDDSTEERDPDWWHRDHPTFTALAGFFSGLAFVCAVPALYAALTQLVFSDDTAQTLFPFVLVLLVVPLGLLLTERTRRFGRYMLLGMVATAVVVAGVTALVLWVLTSGEG